MLAEIVDRPDGLPNVVVEGTPICGTDFCDRCGDCLHCYDGPCYNGVGEEEEHRWVVYADLEPDRAAELLSAAPC